MQKDYKAQLIIEDLQREHPDLVIKDQAGMEEALSLEADKYQGMGIKALSIVGGVLASSFFIGFVVMILMEWSVVLLISGLLAVAATVVLEKVSKSLVMDTISISAYLSANLMIGMAVHQLTKDDNAVCSALIVVSLIVPFLTAGYMLNFLSVLMIHGCLFAFLNINGGKEWVHLFLLLPAVVYTFLSLSEPRLLTTGAAINIRFSAWRTGVLMALIAAVLYSASLLFTPGSVHDNWVRILALPIWTALLIIFISFWKGHKIGLVAGIILLIYAVGQFYYNLDLNLLTKSYMMMGTGLLFLIVWSIFQEKA